MSIEVQGLKQNLRILNGFNPALRKEIGKEFRALAKPSQDKANASRKGADWPRGFEHGGRTGIRSDKAVAVKMNTRRARSRNLAQGATFETLAVIAIQTRSAASAIADMAGKTNLVQYSGRSRAYPGRPTGHALNGQGGGLIRGLNKHMGQPSRFMWPAVEQTASDYEIALRALVERVEKIVNAEVMKIGSTAAEMRRMMR